MTNTKDTKQIMQPIALSDAGGVRAFDLLTSNAAALLMGMIRITCRTGGNEAVIAQANADDDAAKEKEAQNID